VALGDYVFMGGLAAAHQFAWSRYSFIGGLAAVTRTSFRMARSGATTPISKA
jgi:acyl-[acyl carrier protein]--UDP-N-acetylglucosamine O-acyltransferase